MRRAMESLKENLMPPGNWFEELSAVYIINVWYGLPPKYHLWTSNQPSNATFTCK